MFCEFDEMSIDSIPNKIIKKTLLNLLSSEYQFNNKERIKPILRHFEECKASNNVDHYLKQLRLNNSNDLDAAKKLIMHNLRYVVYIARSYTGYGLNLNDLIQEGNVGLMKAVKNLIQKKK